MRRKFHSHSIQIDMKSRFNILLIVAGVAIVSCSEEVKPTPYTYTQVFTGVHSKTWKVKFLEQTLKGDIVDTFTVTCATDDQYRFYSGSERTLEITTGSKKCADGEADLITDSWGFNNSSATLTMILPFLADFQLPM